MTGFGLENLPFGVARLPGGRTACVSAFDSDVIDLARLATARFFPDVPDGIFERPSLNAFLGCGRPVWEGVRRRLAVGFAAGDDRLAAALAPREGAELLLPVAVGDFVDFSASLHHGDRMARLLRPGDDPRAAQRRRSPVAYHGRAGTLVVSGTEIVRPHGQVGDRGGGELRPTDALDIEAEVGFVVGTGSPLGTPIPAGAFRDHVAGVVLVNDWSARDFQAYESRPLGPFLAKSFATSISPWLVTLEALEPYLVAAQKQDPALAPYLAAGAGCTYDIRLEVSIRSDAMRASGHPPTTISRPPLASTYWTPAQLVAHATVNGASTRPGDLIASGTVSGPAAGSEGTLIELTANGRDPLPLPDGTHRAYLDDGDVVTVAGWAGGGGSGSGGGLPLISLGEVTGKILPARTQEA